MLKIEELQIARFARSPDSFNQQARNYPLPNLFVSMLQRMGIAEDAFASSTGTMRGLENV